MTLAISILKMILPLSRWLNILAMVSLVAMVLLTVADVFLRFVFNRPVSGSVEIVELLMIGSVFFGLAYCQSQKGHVVLDLITSRLKPKVQLMLEGATNIISLAVFSILIWRTTLYALQNTFVYTWVLRIPVWPFMLIISATSTLLVIHLLRQLLEIIVEGKKLQFDSKYWLGTFGIAALVIGGSLALLAAAPLNINAIFLGLIGLVFMFVFFFLGMPIGFTLIGIGFLFLGFIAGQASGFTMIQVTWYRTIANYPWSPLILFVFMGFICFSSGLGRDLFDTAIKFLGHLIGGLAMSVVAACTAFGAVVGDTLTGSITMTTIALPEMRRFNYKDILSIGTLTCSGTIGTLIPPSVSFIIYAVLAEQSIGELFIAGIIPGLITAIVFMVMIYVRCRLNPSLGPSGERSNWKARAISLKSTGPIAALFLLVIGGIYGGVFTPTEAGGIGCFGALVIALGMRRLNWPNFKDCVTRAARFNAMNFIILGGAMHFSFFIARSKLPLAMAQFLEAQELSSMVILGAIIVVLLLLGCFMPGLALKLVTIPIFLPIAIYYDWDLIWFGVIYTLTGDVGVISPPYGINLFIVKGLTGVSTGTIFRAALPFCLAFLIIIVIIVAFPSLSTWLPYLLR